MKAGFALGALALALAGCAPVPTAAVAPDRGWSGLAAMVDSAVAAGAAPGAVVGVSIAGRRWVHAAGRLGLDDPSAPDAGTVYDLASLTKVVALTPLVLEAVESARLDLDEPVARRVPEFSGPGKDAVTLRHLLTHSSGLPDWRPLYREAPDRDSALALLFATPLDTAPGTHERYSDLGLILAGILIERLDGAPLDSLAARRLAALGLGDTRYRPPAAWSRRIAPTELDPWRGRMLRGEVHDENAARLGGVSGHAGLFGSTRDLLRYGEWWLARVGRGGPGGAAAWGPPRTRLDSLARAFSARQGVVPGSSRALGWDTPSEGSSAGPRLANWSFGHTGFTGTSLWVDPSRALVVVLLTNRVHPTRDNPRVGPLRRAVAARAAELADRAAR
ncbi:MAG TPA: serine hydrolase domain-containing protein [Gemmatimonadales bacterium]|nr:serine hydrolase domain-containing protein [Gemmatimonadales bacterium]